MVYNNFVEEYPYFHKFYYSNVCHVCKINNDFLKRCSSCKLVSYCSIEHQKLHWKTHKEFCRVVKDMLIDFNKKHIYDGPEFINSKRNLVVLGQCMSMLWKEKLNRELSVEEDQMWMFPRACAYCFSCDVLTNCQDCLVVSYCSTDHRNLHKLTHDKNCALLKLSFDIDLLLTQGKEPANVRYNIPDEINEFPKSTDYFLDYFVEQETENVKKALIGDTLSVSLTILFILKRINLIEKRMSKKSSLRIHIIGAGKTEISFNWKLILDIIFIWLKNLQTVDIICIGPESEPIEKKIECSNDKHANIFYKKELYHGYVLNNENDIPDVRVCFNCGFHEYENNALYDTWKATIEKVFLCSDVPLALTSYTLKEAQMDFKRLSFTGDSVIDECEKNNFASTRPLRDWTCDDLYYSNNYISIIIPS